MSSVPGIATGILRKIRACSGLPTQIQGNRGKSQEKVHSGVDRRRFSSSLQPGITAGTTEKSAKKGVDEKNNDVYGERGLKHSYQGLPSWELSALLAGDLARYSPLQTLRNCNYFGKTRCRSPVRRRRRSIGFLSRSVSRGVDQGRSKTRVSTRVINFAELILLAWSCFRSSGSPAPHQVVKKERDQQRRADTGPGITTGR